MLEHQHDENKMFFAVVVEMVPSLHQKKVALWLSIDRYLCDAFYVEVKHTAHTHFTYHTNWRSRWVFAGKRLRRDSPQNQRTHA